MPAFCRCNNLLVYVKGGASWTSVKYNFSDGGLLAPGSLTSNATETKVGGLLGFGTEYMFAPHWTAKIEYNYVDYGNHTDNHPLTAAFPGIPAATINVPVQIQPQGQHDEGGHQLPVLIDATWCSKEAPGRNTPELFHCAPSRLAGGSGLSSQARSTPPVRLPTSATIFAASASISASVMVLSRGWMVTAMAIDFLPGSMPLPS